MKLSFLYCALAIFFFSTLEFVGKLVGTSINPLALTVYRFYIGSLILLIPALIIIRKQKLEVKLSSVINMSIPGIINITLSMYFLQLGIFYGKALIAAILISSNSVFVSIFAMFMLKEKLTIQRALGIVIGLIGMVLVIQGNQGQDLVPPKSVSLGVIFSLLASVLFALYTVMSKKMIKQYGNIIYNSISFFSGATVLLIVGLIMGVSYKITITPTSISSLLYLGIIVTGLAYFLYSKGLEKIPASSSAMFFLLKPVFASALAVLVLHESFSSIQGVGLIFILLGLSLEYIWTNLIKNKANSQVS